jgi:hypothetical protein
MRSSKIGTVALIVRLDGDQAPNLVEKFSDDREIAAFETAMKAGDADPLSTVYTMRDRQAKEDEEFGDYVEELLSQPFVRPEIQEHGVQWLKSKIRIEQFQKCEREATQIIADYAFRLFSENPSRTDFFLAGPAAKVRIRIFTLPSVNEESTPGSRAA